MSYFPCYGHNKNNIKVKLDLSNYATKSDLKNPTHVDLLQFAKKNYLGSLKPVADKLDGDKLAHCHTDLSKLSDVVKN